LLEQIIFKSNPSASIDIKSIIVLAGKCSFRISFNGTVAIFLVKRISALLVLASDIFFKKPFSAGSLKA
jgi:hypothetical protein